MIIGYDIIVYDVLKNTSENITVNEKQFIKYGLKKYYNYSICVAARTSVGRGNCSAWIERRTLESGKGNFLSSTVVKSLSLICAKVHPPSTPHTVKINWLK